MKKSVVFSLAALATFFAVQTSRAIVIADWTFETSQPITAGPFSSEIGSGSALGFHTGVATYSSPAGNGSAHSFSANTWALNDYFQFSLSTVGFTGISLSFDQQGSATGPKIFILQYSIDGASFASVGSTYSLVTAATYFTENYDLSLNPLVENASTLYFRIVDQSATSGGAINGGNVGTSGTDRIDNFIVSGSVRSAPEQNSSFVLALLGISACFIFGRKTQRLA